MKKGGSKRLFRRDGHSPVEAHYDYAAFGAVIAQKGDCAEANPWRFSCEYEDTDLGLDYYNYRHYEPMTGRWQVLDPVNERGGLLLYSFCNNNALRAYDYLGNAPQYIYPETQVVYELGKGGRIQLSPDIDYGGRLDVDGDPSGSAGGSFLFSKHEIIGVNGCFFYCFSITTQLAGFSVGGSIGSGSAWSSAFGMKGVYVEVSGIDGGIGGGYGISLAPAETSLRLFCFKLNDTDNEGCPCERSAPASALGLQN